MALPMPIQLQRSNKKTSKTAEIVTNTPRKASNVGASPEFSADAVLQYKPSTNGQTTEQQTNAKEKEYVVNSVVNNTNSKKVALSYQKMNIDDGTLRTQHAAAALKKMFGNDNQFMHNNSGFNNIQNEQTGNDSAPTSTATKYFGQSEQPESKKTCSSTGSSIKYPAMRPSMVVEQATEMNLTLSTDQLKLPQHNSLLPRATSTILSAKPVLFQDFAKEELLTSVHNHFQDIGNYNVVDNNNKMCAKNQNKIESSNHSTPEIEQKLMSALTPVKSSAATECPAGLRCADTDLNNFSEVCPILNNELVNSNTNGIHVSHAPFADMVTEKALVKSGAVYDPLLCEPVLNNCMHSATKTSEVNDSAVELQRCSTKFSTTPYNASSQLPTSPPLSEMKGISHEIIYGTMLPDEARDIVAIWDSDVSELDTMRELVIQPISILRERELLERVNIVLNPHGESVSSSGIDEHFRLLIDDETNQDMLDWLKEQLDQCRIALLSAQQADSESKRSIRKTAANVSTHKIPASVQSSSTKMIGDMTDIISKIEHLRDIVTDTRANCSTIDELSDDTDHDGKVEVEKEPGLVRADTVFQLNQMLAKRDRVAVLVFENVEQHILPKIRDRLTEDSKMQALLFAFFQHCLSLHMADVVSLRLLEIIDKLLANHHLAISKLTKDQQHARRCFAYWRSFWRLAMSESKSVRNIVSKIMYRIFASIFTESGSLTRVLRPIVHGFANTFDSLRSYKIDMQQPGILQKPWPERRPDDNFVNQINNIAKTILHVMYKAVNYLSKPEQHHSVIACSIEALNIFQNFVAIMESSSVLNTTRITNSRNCCPEFRAELAEQVTKFYCNAPQQQLEYFKLTYDLQHKNVNHIECAFCQLAMADVIENELAFMKLHSYIEAENSICTNLNFELCLQQACTHFIYGKAWQLANTTQRRLVQFYLAANNYQRVSECYETISKNCRNMLAEQDSNTTFSCGTYFRVAFNGNFGWEVDGKEFVYREQLHTHISEVASKLTALYSKQLGIEVKLHKEGGIVENNETRLQITAVQPFKDRNASLSTLCTVETDLSNELAQFTASEFYFDVPFTPSGNSYGVLAEQHKRRTVLILSSALPGCQQRRPVVRKREIILTPIECVLEDVAVRKAALQRASERDTVSRVGASNSIKSLHQLLSGTCNTQVNGGPFEVYNTFLTGSASCKYDESNRRSLQNELHGLMKACEFALKVSKWLCSQNDVLLQETLEQSFHALQGKMQLEDSKQL